MAGGGWEWHVYQCVAWADSHGMCYEACTLQAELISMITHSFENSERLLGSVVSNVYGYWERYVCMVGSWDTPYHLPGRSFLFSFCKQSVSFFLVLSANFAWWARSLLSSKSGESSHRKSGRLDSATMGGGKPYRAWKGVIFREVWKVVLYYHSASASQECHLVGCWKAMHRGNFPSIG